MKKKISVAALLLSLLLALAVPVQAKAEEETKVIPAGTYTFIDEPLNNVPDELVDVYVPIKFYYMYSGQNDRIGIKVNSTGLYYYRKTTSSSCMCFVQDGVYSWYDTPQAKQIIVVEDAVVPRVFYDWFASNVDDPEGLLIDLYTFEEWCTDAGLSCAASSNESSSVIPYSYNDYWHIVRRSSSGQWLLTTIGNSKLQQDMQLRISEDEGNLIIYNTYSGDGTDSSSNGYLVNVRQYVYDTDGWKQLSFSTYDFRELIDVVLDLEAGTGFDDTKILAYTNTDIYSFNGYAIIHAASTEFNDLFDIPIITITPTPTTAPGSSGGGESGSGSRPGSGTASGGQATGGGGLDFIINLFTLIWTKICSVPMAVDGYSISLQQLFVYGALVSIIGGFIMHFIFGRK